MNHLLKRVITAQDGAGHAPLQGAAVVSQAKVDQLMRRLLPLLEENVHNNKIKVNGQKTPYHVLLYFDFSNSHLNLNFVELKRKAQASPISFDSLLWIYF